MLGKRARPCLDEEEYLPEERLRRNVAALFTEGTVPAHKVQGLIDNIANLRRPDAFEALSSANSGDGSSANLARNLLQKLKSRAWPPLYFQDVTVCNKLTGEEVLILQNSDLG